MFGSLTEKFHSLFSSLAGKKQISEENIAEAVKEVRLALLDADVNYSVASQFVQRVKEKALGSQVVRSVTAHQQFVQIIHDELVALMGGVDEEPIKVRGAPTVVLLCGLQGSGKTTHCAKLAHYFTSKERQKKVLVAACDLQRPAAIEQLRKLCGVIQVPFFTVEGSSDPVHVAEKALEHARKERFDILLLDTAGRLHIDDELMNELQEIKRATNPHEVLYVASAATGQDAVKTALEFDQRISITGSILTMLDGTARAGAAISIREVTKKPLLFEGIGEKIEDLQLFNSHSMADRILGMGDVINLVRKAKEHFDEEESLKLEKKLKKANFTYDDFLKQMGAIKKMGPIKSLLRMIPGLPSLPDMDRSDSEFKKMEAIILSMTLKERNEQVELIPARRWRIAKGSGTHVDDVNRLVKGFKNIKQMMKQMPKMKGDFFQQFGQANNK